MRVLTLLQTLNPMQESQIVVSEYWHLTILRIYKRTVVVINIRNLILQTNKFLFLLFLYA